MFKTVARTCFTLAAALGLLALSGCAGSQIRGTSLPSESKRQYLSLKKVAILPFNNIGGDKGAEDQIIDILVTEMTVQKTFEEVEDPHYVANVLKALKIRKIEDLDLETVKKMGSEMRAQAILLGNINAWGLGKGTDAAMQVNVTLTLMDTTTGKPLWIGNGARRASFTVSRAFGLDEGPTDLEVGRQVIAGMVDSMKTEIQDRQEVELARIQEEEEAKLKAAAEAEKRRLLEQPGESPAPQP